MGRNSEFAGGDQEFERGTERNSEIVGSNQDQLGREQFADDRNLPEPTDSTQTRTGGKHECQHDATNQGTTKEAKKRLYSNNKQYRKRDADFER